MSRRLPLVSLFTLYGWFAALMLLVAASAGIAAPAAPMISMGAKHGLALRSDGTVVAWGSDEFGQLGVGRAVYSAVPVIVPGLAGVRAIGSGADYTLAVKSDGSVWAWGKNPYGQLGDGSRADRASPVQVAGIANVSSVAAGSWHSIALKQDGTVWGWGGNFYGQLGAGTSVSDYDSPVPVQAVGLDQIVSIAAGGSHSVALRQDGTVWTWGANQFGQLGDGTSIDRKVPVQVPGLSDVIAVGAGAAISTALKRDGTVWEWGIDVSVGGPYGRMTPVQSQGVSGAVSVGTGGTAITAVLPDGTAWHWEAGRAPAPLAGASGISNASSVMGTHTLLLKADQTILGFGGNSHGQIGDGTTIERWEPVAVAGLSGIVALSGGAFHSAALGSDGTVWTWGSDAVGQLGRGAVTNQSIPAQVSGLADVIYVSAGLNHNLAVKQDGTVWAWGYNQAGQLGDGTHTNRSTPVAVGGITDVRVVAAGGAHSLALRQDGTLWAWGFNYDGAIGDGTNMESTTPVQVPGMAGVTSIAAAFHSLAVKQDGTVWAWGLNYFGVLGLGTVTPIGDFYHPSTANSRPAQVPGLVNIRSVAAAVCNSYALGADGSAWAWGGSMDGMPGCYTLNVPAPQKISGLSQVAAMSGGSMHALAYRSDGTVWGWGLNHSGQLGDGVSAALASPAQLAGITSVSQISAGYSFSGFLRQDGTVSMTGENLAGQLGDGTFAQRRSPVLAVNTSGDGFLNLNPGAVFDVPPALGVPFFVVASGGISDVGASVSTATRFNAADAGKPGAVYVTAAVPPGSLVPAQSAMSARGASGPGSLAVTGSNPFVLIQLTASGWQPVVNGQLLPYASGVLGDQLAAQTILNNTDTTNLKGAQFCLSYGASADEMSAAGRMRVVATIPDPNATSAAAASCMVGTPVITTTSTTTTSAASTSTTTPSTTSTVASTTTTTLAGGAAALNLVPGWNLLGNSSSAVLNVASAFGDQSRVATVWKWIAAKAIWAFYTPATADGGAAYAVGKGYDFMTFVAGGEGFWVNAKTAFTAPLPSGSTISSASFQGMATGWNLIAIGDNKTPRAFNSAIGLTAPAAGDIPINLNTLWAWDAAQSNWYFYAPSLDKSGGLASYIGSKGFLDFGSNALGPAAGFWVNR